MTDQVEVLLGRTLSSIEGVDFEVAIVERGRKQWQLRVVTIDRADGGRRTREISGLGCNELAEAAAVAITISINASAGDEETSGVAGRRSPPATTERRALEPSGAVIPARERHTGTSTRAEVPPPQRGQFSLGVGVVGDTGTLPHAGLGAELQGGWRLGALQVLGLATFLPAQESRLGGGLGGSFQLIAGGALACLTARAGRIDILGCGGGELGRLAGEGFGVSDPHVGAALWRAGLAELGGSLAVTPRLAAQVRIGLVLPLSRPVFVLEGTRPVYQPGGLMGRMTLGVDFDL